MKTLQNNFTTPELSKRLLELGVPADSADCSIDEWGRVHKIPQDFLLFSQLKRQTFYTILPCWSVGRLIEIANICGTRTNPIEFWWRDTPMDDVLFEFYNEMDFSKLEG